jgi:hypothetical protein
MEEPEGSSSLLKSMKVEKDGRDGFQSSSNGGRSAGHNFLANPFPRPLVQHRSIVFLKSEQVYFH